MTILFARNIEKSFGDRTLFTLPSLEIQAQDRIGIVGVNGAGKSTLLQILSKEIEADKGIITHHSSISIIPQLSEELPETTSALAKGKWSISNVTDAMSGGERMRLKIAHALEQDAGILFADEPTSHLDMVGTEQLEKALLSYKGSLVLISHDREFLDNICTKIIEIEDGTIQEYKGNYSNYRKQKERERTQKQAEYDQYIQEKNRLEQSISQKKQRTSNMTKIPTRFSSSESKLYKLSGAHGQEQVSKAANALETRLEKLEKKEKPKDLSQTQFDVQYHTPIHSKVAVQFNKATKKIGDRTLFKNMNGTIAPGAKLAILGANGSGKTTLFNMLLANERGIQLSKSCKIGYFEQTLSILKTDKTILENVLEETNYTEAFVRTILARLLFRREDVHKPVHVLSGGERMKVALAKVFLGNYNMLLLDEPTNYLDLATQEELEIMLQEYPGTILFISHDRAFIRSVADHILQVDESKPRIFHGNYEQYTKRTTGDSVNVTEQELLRLQTKLTEIIGRISMPNHHDDIPSLEQEYETLLVQIQKCKEAL
ncbi:ribosomal protection-like ABC-F family protein [Bacillus wiedmannii]|uniref:ribosomal protection-like ABC-F family protein n=1 Tax=Bacillus wiedmannii TaxID=1890302 RepID=UPI0007DB47D6|nr:ABC-F type ribosomal protection protein [Bacillus wiedmannii]OAK36094.1 ABC-F type ribosomal protection protein [Bacillus wiedmannii]HDR7661778.1 ABC-F type ribosomal protection protein [Bacillus wiedmannii]